MKLKHCKNIEDLRKRSHKKLPAPIFHFLDGGADDEVTLRRNTSAFDDIELISNYLVNIQDLDLATNVLDQRLDWPVILAPTGMSRLFHHTAEPAVARAAARAGSLYTLSTMATTTLEDIATLTNSPKMFQIYILRDRELTKEFVTRCKSSSYEALCLTVDAPVAGNRERDIVNGMTMPPRFNLKNLWSYATHFEWFFNVLLHPDFALKNIVHRQDVLGKGAMSIIDYVNKQFDPTICWDDAAWLAEQWDGPFVIKGIHSVHDALKAKEIGASAIMISNHGGRQLDGVPAAIDCLPDIRDAVGDEMELIVDGGIRRGTHIIKALALGANAVSIGRSYLYGLAAGGEKGVEMALEMLKTELVRGLTLLGCNSIEKLNASYIHNSYSA